MPDPIPRESMQQRVTGSGLPGGRHRILQGAGRSARFWLLLSRLILVGLPAGVCATGGAITAQEPQSAPAADSLPDQRHSLEPMEKWLTRLVIEEAGLEWSDDRDWGGQERVQEGIRFRRDEGGKLETERVWKNVNHGSWERYSARVRPGAGNFRITLPRMETDPGGGSRITLQIRALLDLEARHSQWSRGLQLYSISAEGWADVEVTLDLRLSTLPDWSTIPPTVVLQPVVDAAHVTLHELQLDRVSKLGGEFSQQVGRLAQRVISARLAEKEQGLVDRLNRQIGKHRDQLRFSPADIQLPDWARTAASGREGAAGVLPPGESSAAAAADR